MAALSELASVLVEHDRDAQGGLFTATWHTGWIQVNTTRQRSPCANGRTYNAAINSLWNQVASHEITLQLPDGRRVRWNAKWQEVPP